MDHPPGRRSRCRRQLDRPASAVYRQRVADLRDELADTERDNDSGHAELDAVTSELAWLNVTRTVGLGLSEIAAEHPALGEHLARTIRTGTFCSYALDPRVPIEC